MPKTRYSTFLVIPDVHAYPGQNFKRFDRLNAFLKGRQVDSIVQIGDLWDFPSLCTHEMHTPEWHHQNLEADIQAGFDALTKIREIAYSRNIPNYEIHITEGNHEHRYNKWMASDNRLKTSTFPKTVRDLLFKQGPNVRGLHYHDFQSPFIYNETAFCHYFVSGVMNRPQGGERPAANILRSQLMSCISGHTHVLDFAERTRADSTKICALVSGCFVDPNQPFNYAGAARRLWWNGAHLIHFTNACGEFDIESISLNRLQ